MRQHPVNAYNMLYPITHLRPPWTSLIVTTRNGMAAGIPAILKGEEIPLAARIFTIIDVWDALRSNRPYRKAWSLKKTITYIQQQAGEIL